LLAGGAIGRIVHAEFRQLRVRQRRCYFYREDTNQLIFAAQPNMRAAHRNLIPRAQLESFVLATASEWFDQREHVAKQASNSIDPFVIFAQRRDGGPIVVASHVGNKKEMAELHAVLSKLFVEQHIR
jgi:hypothetical protein